MREGFFLFQRQQMPRLPLQPSAWHGVATASSSIFVSVGGWRGGGSWFRTGEHEPNYCVTLRVRNVMGRVIQPVLMTWTPWPLASSMRIPASLEQPPTHQSSGDRSGSQHMHRVQNLGGEARSARTLRARGLRNYRGIRVWVGSDFEELVSTSRRLSLPLLENGSEPSFMTVVSISTKG